MPEHTGSADSMLSLVSILIREAPGERPERVEAIFGQQSRETFPGAAV